MNTPVPPPSPTHFFERTDEIFEKLGSLKMFF